MASLVLLTALTGAVFLSSVSRPRRPGSGRARRCSRRSLCNSSVEQGAALLCSRSRGPDLFLSRKHRETSQWTQARCTETADGPPTFALRTGKMAHLRPPKPTKIALHKAAFWQVYGSARRTGPVLSLQSTGGVQGRIKQPKVVSIGAIDGSKLAWCRHTLHRSSVAGSWQWCRVDDLNEFLNHNPTSTSQ